MRTTRMAVAALAAGLLAFTASAAEASAPGWSTPQAISTYAVGVFGAGPNGQGVQLFANGAAQTRTAQMRGIQKDASQGGAKPIDAGRPGFDAPSVSVNATGQLVSAWTLDTQQPGPIGLAAALGTRANLPRTASVLPTTGSVGDLATAITDGDIALVAWIEFSSGPPVVKAATLRPGQAPQNVVLTTRANATLTNVSAGFDSASKPIVTWAVDPITAGTPPVIGIARGDGLGGFAPAVENAVATGALNNLKTFTTVNGSLIALWSDGVVGAGKPIQVKTAEALPGASLGGTQTLTSGTQGAAPAFGANASGRAGVILPSASGSDTKLRVVLRSATGTWGTARTVGASGRYVAHADIGVDAKSRVVALWDDGASKSSGPTRILAARSGSSTDPLGSYHQLSQRSNDKRCSGATLIVSTSGDGLGRWDCSTKSSGSINGPRLARLTKAS